MLRWPRILIYCGVFYSEVILYQRVNLCIRFKIQLFFHSHCPFKRLIFTSLCNKLLVVQITQALDKWLYNFRLLLLSYVTFVVWYYTLLQMYYFRLIAHVMMNDLTGHEDFFEWMFSLSLSPPPLHTPPPCLAQFPGFFVTLDCLYLSPLYVDMRGWNRTCTVKDFTKTISWNCVPAIIKYFLGCMYQSTHF